MVNCVTENSVDAFYQELTKRFGKGHIKSGKDVLDRPQIVIPVTPALDIGLKGGIPEGSWVTVTGPAKWGKTTLLLHFAANCQKPEYGGREVFYLNVEGRLKKMNLAGIPGLNLEKFHVIESEPGKILSAEQYLQRADLAVKSVPGCVMIIDSYSMLTTEKELIEDMDQMQRADGAKLLAKFCRKLAGTVPVNRNIICGITHEQGNPGYGNPTQEGGGKKILYQVDVKLKAKNMEYWKLTDDSDPLGQITHWQILCSALGGSQAVVKSFHRFGQGIDHAREVVELASDFGIIKKGGSWYTITVDGKEIKMQGINKLTEYLRESPDVLNTVNNTLRTMFGLGELNVSSGN